MRATRKGSSATQRLRQDYLHIVKDPVPYVTAHPIPINILEWHYVVLGPEGTPYEDGIYHGKLVFPTEFPFKPPSIFMITPNGRFKCNTRLCLSISDFHPDSWNPTWTVSTILTGLLSFMVERNPTLGSIETSDFEKKQLARRSWEFNLKDATFCDLFPEFVNEIHENLQKEKRKSEKANQEMTLGTQISNFSQEVYRDQRQGVLGSALTNMFVIVGFAAFAFTVKYIIMSTAK